MNQDEHTMLIVKSNLIKSSLRDYNDAYILAKGTTAQLLQMLMQIILITR